MYTSRWPDTGVSDHRQARPVRTVLVALCMLTLVLQSDCTYSGGWTIFVLPSSTWLPLANGIALSFSALSVHFLGIDYGVLSRGHFCCGAFIQWI
jgi:hypothetical protein